jgi:hypothetical protein
MIGPRRAAWAAIAALGASGCLAAPEPTIARPASICIGDLGPPAASERPRSLVSYPGWSQGDAPPDALYDFLTTSAVFTHVVHASVAPDATGALGFGEGDLWDPAQSCNAVVGAHAAGRPIFIALGGDNHGAAMAAAARPALRATFVQSIVAFVDTYGYDGISLAWFDTVDPDDLQALVAELADAFARRAPRPLIAMYTNSGIIDPAVVAAMSPDLDAVHVMSYFASDLEQVDIHLAAGVPREIIQLGIGLVADMVDTTPDDVAAKILRVHELGLLGVESWEVGALAPGDPRIASYYAL